MNQVFTWGGGGVGRLGTAVGSSPLEDANRTRAVPLFQNPFSEFPAQVDLSKPEALID
jgi:hypothetical protein